MAIKISAIPDATNITAGDVFIFNQSGTTKKVPASTLFQFAASAGLALDNGTTGQDETKYS